MKNRKIFLVWYGDGGFVGAYTTQRKAFNAAAIVARANGWTTQCWDLKNFLKLFEEGDSSVVLRVDKWSGKADISKTFIFKSVFLI